MLICFRELISSVLIISTGFGCSSPLKVLAKTSKHKFDAILIESWKGIIKGIHFKFRRVCFFQILRVRAFFHKTVRVCHVYCNFKIGFTCRITVIFGTLKDGSLLINTLASNICFSYRNMFQNGVDALPKIVDAFLSKSSKFHLVRFIR